MEIQGLRILVMSSFLFQLPESEYNRDDITIIVEYSKAPHNPAEIICWAWVQIGDADIRGNLAVISMPFIDDAVALRYAIIEALQNHKGYHRSLSMFVKQRIEFELEEQEADLSL